MFTSLVFDNLALHVGWFIALIILNCTRHCTTTTTTTTTNNNNNNIHYLSSDDLNISFALTILTGSSFRSSTDNTQSPKHKVI